jgi:2-oxoglutarate ferredoxin oxidoreductase subunit alpha
MILADGVIGQMMEKVILPEQRPRKTDEEIRQEQPWATLGKPKNRKPNVVTSLELDSSVMERNNIRFQDKYRQIEANEVIYEELFCDDAEYLIVAFGSAARVSQKAVEIARKEGIKVGLFRPVTLWPFPKKQLKAYSKKVKGILTVELNAGQMVEDVQLAVECKVPVNHFGRLGGIVPTPDEVVEEMRKMKK